MKALTIALILLLAGALQTAAAQNAPKPAAEEVRKMSAAALRVDLRKLWSDHVFWTRDYAAAAIAKQPDATAASMRLLKNQEDIGNAIATYYGRAAGDKLAALLKEHITIAVDLIKAAVAHDDSRFKDIDQKWTRNGDDIADFLSKANPHWSKAALTDMMRMHLTTTKDEVSARVNRNWEQDVKAFDAVYDHILKMSDALADGIVKQFPEKFSEKAH